uniref:Fe2OG dioxygenase domain-containing protein n=1 Tax=Chlamydomonas chlamydogama TaxID=225041 RepID=A0A7S2VVK6_9CHLO|mmetsp:Transcript_2092/g.4736  ORF Transcript_2092/g.4736 Transcript_2092/m.4736 type:complete len:427 (+) Transcript_2092:120-1400(+)|eukprot:CAMPEP_0202909416 /NCGR_PEP_ID=MMETSP1392-20130828/49259_1 /ASSEMBLY_ACC=CAM_ASM_000868 /TAXON_ID=225041 /ORGANISM="Chlamydomonas chlamydogama, Strain SAG 11-48b" /LENGTH=426 /DNA_ID=CAMNT_0049599153 /DNA_START=119 /DNA_END=1399 /DNA_ORIENTATION=-
MSPATEVEQRPPDAALPHCQSHVAHINPDGLVPSAGANPAGVNHTGVVPAGANPAGINPNGLVPIIDMAGLRGPADSPSTVEACRNLLQVANRVGFFYVTNHGVPPELLEAKLHQARTLFGLPLTTKQQLHMGRAGPYRGWSGFKEETTAGKADKKESYDIWANPPRSTQGVSEALNTLDTARMDATYQALLGDNLWPSERDVPGFRATHEAFVASTSHVAQCLLRGFAIALGLGETYFHDMCGPETSFRFMRHNYYPPVADADVSDGFGVGPHTDLGWLTILAQNNIGGLQVQGLDGQWIDATPIDNTILINLGDVLQWWSGGLLRATPHRVLPNAHPTTARISLPLFYEPCLHAVVRPMQWSGEQLEELEQAQGVRPVPGAALPEWAPLVPGGAGGGTPGLLYGEYLLTTYNRSFQHLKGGDKQ